MLDTGRWILDEPESRIKDHISSIQYQESRNQHQIFFGSGFSEIGNKRNQGICKSHEKAYVKVMKWITIQDLDKKGISRD